MNVLNVGTWYNIRKVIDKATSNDETVTSGFIYNEINQLTNESDYHCQQVLENLIYKLSYDKPIIKRKALLVIKSCIERGNPNFRRDLHHKMEDLRKASNYTGVPDKLEGEAPYKRVREEANKVMNMMYDTRTTKKYSTDNIEGNKPSGLGQDTKVFHEYQDGSTGLNPSSNKIKLESYGNWKPTPQQKSTTEKVLEVGGQLVGGVSNLSSVAYNKVKTVITGKEETKPYEPSFEKSYYVPPSSNNVDFSGTGNIRKLAEGSKWEEHKTRRKKGEVSDSWNVDSSNDSYYDDNNTSSSPKSTPKHSNNGSSNKPKFDYSFQSNFDFINDNQYGGSSSSSSNFSGDSNNSPFDPNAPEQSSNKQQDDQVDEAVEQYCFKLVEEITTPSGLRNHLEPTAINTFLKKAESLNIEVISFCLDAKLEDQNQKTILNALTLIESLLNSNNTAYKYFLDNTRNVENHTESPNQTVKSKATTVLNLILLKQKAKKKKTKKKKSTKNTTNSTNSSSPSPQTNNTTNNNNSLLNFLNETNTTPNNNNTNNNNNVTNTNQQNGNFNTNQQGNLLGFLETNTTSNLNVNNNTNNTNNNNTNNTNNNNNQFSILDDIKNLNISSNRAPPLNNLLNNYSPNPYPVHSHVQAPVYYNYPYQPPVVSYPSHPHTTLYSSPVTPQPTVSVNDSKNDSAFSFINDEIKKEVK